MKSHAYWVLVSALALGACASSKPAQRPDEGLHESSSTVVVRDPQTPPARAVEEPAAVQARRRAPSGATGSEHARQQERERRQEQEPIVAAPPVAIAEEPDNTAVNKRDTKAGALTAMDQGEGERDLDITQRIRQAVVGDDSLSFGAKNVKIITVDGKVTLRGPVASAKERTTIGAAAKSVAGVGHVDNQLEIEK